MTQDKGPHDNEGGEAVIEDGYIVIRVPIRALPLILAGNQHEVLPKVTDPELFAIDLVQCINGDDETGYNAFERWFDGMTSQAIMEGADGVEDP